MPGNELPEGRSYAFLMATGRYSDPMLVQLRSPSRDAEELAKVLRDPAVGGFKNVTLIDKPDSQLREEIEGFFADRRLDDLLVFYVSCHGVKDASGRLYFAASTTKLNRLASTGISAEFLYEQVDRCRARKILVLLDCCYSGSYAKDHLPRAAERVEIGLREGRGRAAISSSTEEEYSFEVGTRKVTGSAAPSLFTAALVEGLSTGAADVDGDGLVSVDDLYTYVRDHVRQATPYQTPEKKWGDIRGDFFIARNPNPPKAEAEPLPAELLGAFNSPYASVRHGAVQELAQLARGDRKGVAATALDRLRELQGDDSRLVSAAAGTALAELRGPAGSKERVPLAPSPPAARQARLHSGPDKNYRPITGRRFWHIISFILAPLTYGLIVIPMLFTRSRAIRMNVILALEVTIFGAAWLTSTLVGATQMLSIQLKVFLIVLGSLGLAVYLAMLIYCLARIGQRRQPAVPGLTRAAHRLAYRKTEAPWPVRGARSAR